MQSTFQILRTNHIPKLASWLKKSSGYKWLHHSIVEEMLKIIADATLNEVLLEVRKEKYFSLMLDETSDVDRFEQVSICLRYVSDELVIKEQFIGFYETKSTISSTSFQIIKDILIRCHLNMGDIRGQCYDGAANVREGNFWFTVSNQERSTDCIVCALFRSQIELGSSRYINYRH